MSPEEESGYHQHSPRNKNQGNGALILGLEYAYRTVMEPLPIIRRHDDFDMTQQPSCRMRGFHGVD
jgi:hypothetical protein